MSGSSIGYRLLFSSGVDNMPLCSVSSRCKTGNTPCSSIVFAEYFKKFDAGEQIITFSTLYKLQRL